MTREEIAAKVLDVLAEALMLADDEREQVSEDTHFIRDLYVDSLGIVEAALCAEEAFHIDIPDEDVDRLATVRDAIDYIERRLSEAALCGPTATGRGVGMGERMTMPTCADCGATATRLYERTAGNVWLVCDECHQGSWYGEPIAPGPHLIDWEFQSDKYPTTPRGKVPLSVRDPTAQDLLWQYAQRRRDVDEEFASDLELALLAAGYRPGAGA
jgi:acyl carrier protein